MNRPAPPGCWSRLATETAHLRGRPALFLDRDGVVVADTGYLSDPADVALVPGAAETIARFNRAGVPVVLVTNQSGVGRGYFDWAAFEAVQGEIARRLQGEAAGAHFDAEFACGVDPEATDGGGHSWRKPAPGMLFAAAEALEVERAGSLIVGDKAADIEAGRAAGLGGGLLVAGRPGEAAAAQALRTPGFAVMLGRDIAAAQGWLARMAGGRTPC